MHESNRKVNMRKYFKSILFLIVVSIQSNMLSNSSPNVLLTSNSIAGEQLLNGDSNTKLVTNYGDQNDWEYKNVQNQARCVEHNICNENQKHDEVLKVFSNQL